MKLPIMLRSTCDKEVYELKKDIKFLEVKKEELETELKEEKTSKTSTVGLLNGSLKMANARNKELEEEIVEVNRHLTRVMEQYKTRGDELLESQERIKELESKIKGMDWCIQQRDKTITEIRDHNVTMYKKLELANEMYRQFKEKIDKACEIDFVTKIITPADVKKFMKVEDIVELYALIGLAGK